MTWRLILMSGSGLHKLRIAMIGLGLFGLAVASASGLYLHDAQTPAFERALPG